MKKTETIHIRVAPDIKKEAESVINDMGLNLSYAVSVYLKQIINLKRIPFEISTADLKEREKEEKLIHALNKTGGKDISQRSRNIIHLYATDQIDYETALFALRRDS